MPKMGGLSVERFHAKKEEVMEELMKGKEIATQLHTLLLKRGGGPLSLVSPEDMALQIFASFSISLSHLTSGEIPPVDFSSGENKGVKDRRGCYKRRRGSYSWVKVSPTIEDGWAWRKYGQKKILNSEYPRCYYRCSHKHEGCKAIKQVQRKKGGGIISYETTYFNHHTCTETVGPPHLIVGSDPVQHNLISFQTNFQPKDPITLSSLKQEDTQSEDKSSLEDSWQDIIGLDLDVLGYKPQWAPYQEEVVGSQYSSEITRLHDINTFHYLDEINY